MLDLAYTPEEIGDEIGIHDGLVLVSRNDGLFVFWRDGIVVFCSDGLVVFRSIDAIMVESVYDADATERTETGLVTKPDMMQVCDWA